MFGGCLSRASILCRVSPLLRSQKLAAFQARFASDLRYTKSHEWVRPEGSSYAVGLSKFAVEQLGDVVYVDLPNPGTTIDKDTIFGNAESTKATSEITAPLSGTVEEVNNAVTTKPSLLNKSPEGDGWLLKMKATSPKEFEELMTEEEYQKYIRLDNA